MKLTSALLILTLALCELPSALATNVGESLTLGIMSTKTTVLRPLAPQERDMAAIYDICYNGLISVDDDYLPQPCLAESWEESGAGRTWTFQLRSGVTFSDGTPLTAADVVATTQYILDQANAEDTTDKGYYYNLSYYVSSVSASGDSTVVFKLKSGKRNWGFLYELTYPILPADSITADNPPGTGAYVISQFDACNSLTLTANQNWWQAQPQVQEIMVVMYNTPKEVMNAYEYAQVDTILTRSLSASQYRSGTSSLSLSCRTRQLETLLINESSFPLGTLEVRQAIRYAIDVDKLASGAYMGMVERTNLPTIPGTWLYDESVDSSYTYDPDKAIALLNEAGWTDSDGDGVLDMPKEDGSGLYRMHIRIYVYEEPEDSVRVETANSIADMLTAIGFECSVTTMTFSDMQTRLKAGSYDLALAAYNMDVCPDPGFLLMKSNTGNYTRYSSTEMDTLIKEELRTALNQQDYQTALYKVWNQFTQDIPFICLYFRQSKVLTRRMYTTARDIRELEQLRGIDTFHP